MANETTQDAATPPGTIRWWDLFIAFFGGSVVGTALTVAVGLVVAFIAMRHGYKLDAQNLEALARKSFAINHAALAMGDLGLLGGVWLMARWRFARPLRHFFSPVGAVPLLLAVVCGVVLSLALNGANEALSRFFDFRDSDLERALVPHGAAQGAAAFATVVLLAPFVEEFFFRGLLLTWARQQWSLRTSILVSAVTFALLHGHLVLHPGVQGVVYTLGLFIAGVLLALAAVRTGSLWASFALHAAYNATALAMSVFLP